MCFVNLVTDRIISQSIIKIVDSYLHVNTLRIRGRLLLDKIRWTNVK